MDNIFRSTTGIIPAIAMKAIPLVAKTADVSSCRRPPPSWPGASQNKTRAAPFSSARDSDPFYWVCVCDSRVVPDKRGCVSCVYVLFTVCSFAKPVQLFTIVFLTLHSPPHWIIWRDLLRWHRPAEPWGDKTGGLFTILTSPHLMSRPLPSVAPVLFFLSCLRISTLFV